MTCSDCEVNKNIYSFGTCECGNMYSEKLPHPGPRRYESYKESIVDHSDILLDERYAEAWEYKDNDYISLVFSIDSCVGGPSYMHQYPVTIDIEKGQYIYFSDFADINEVLQALQTGNFEVYAGTYSEFSSEDAHAPDVIKQFSETFQEQVSASTTGEGFDRFSSQNIGLDQQYLYIYFLFEKGISFQGYYILGIPKNKLENEN